MFSVEFTDRFRSDVEYYFKKKKYTHIQDDIKPIVAELENGNFVGDEIPNVKIECDGHTYKVRSANTDMKAGKSNGYRIIYYVVKDDMEVYLLTIYSKKDSDRIPSSKEIIEMISQYCID